MSTSSVDQRDLAIFFEVMKLDHYTDAFSTKGFTIDNLHLATESDLDKMRITNKRDRACLIGAVALLRDEAKLGSAEKAERRRQRAAKVRSFARTVGPQERRALANRRKVLEAAESAGGTGTINNTSAAEGQQDRLTMREVTTADGDVIMEFQDDTNEAAMPTFTATVSTANEHARQATIFLAHQRADRPWPKAGSKLSQTLHLSGAAPVSYEPLYKINLDGVSETVCPPHKHNQGFSAKFCRTCADFVSEAMQGSWQYQVIERVIIGEDLFEDVPVWKPFSQTESMKIEYAHKRRQGTVKIRKSMVDLDAALWGTKPIRRVETDAVPFPTLKKRDLALVPEKNLEPQREMVQSIHDMQRTLISETEERRSRLSIEQHEQMCLVQVLADIAAMVDALHFLERQRVEEAETEARGLIEGPDYERALDELYAWEEQSVRDVALKKWENESARIMARQRACLEDMEQVARRDVEAEEAAYRANLDKLVALFNDEVRAYLERVRKKELRSRRNQDGKPRCPVCRKFDCDFFCHPWKGQWKHVGGALDLAPPNKAKTEETLSTLVNRANEREYDEYLLNRKAARSERKAQRRLEEYLRIGNSRSCTSPSDHRAGTPPRVVDDAVGIGVCVGSPPQSALQTSTVPSIDRSVDVTVDRSGDDVLQRPMSAASIRPSRTPTDEDSSLPPRPASAALERGRSASSARRSPSPAGFGGVFRSAVGSSRSVNADSVHQLTKNSRLRVVRAVTASVGSTAL